MNDEEKIYQNVQPIEHDIEQNVEQDDGFDMSVEPTADGGHPWKTVSFGAVAGVLMGGGAFLATQQINAAENEIGAGAPHDVPHIPRAHNVNDDMLFNEAFDAARAEVGPGGAFQWHGATFSTFTSDEWNGMSGADQHAYTQYAYTEFDAQLVNVNDLANDTLATGSGANLSDSVLQLGPESIIDANIEGVRSDEVVVVEDEHILSNNESIDFVVNVESDPTFNDSVGPNADFEQNYGVSYPDDGIAGAEYVSNHGDAGTGDTGTMDDDPCAHISNDSTGDMTAFDDSGVDLGPDVW